MIGKVPKTIQDIHLLNNISILQFYQIPVLLRVSLRSPFWTLGPGTGPQVLFKCQTYAAMDLCARARKCHTAKRDYSEGAPVLWSCFAVWPIFGPSGPTVGARVLCPSVLWSSFRVWPIMCAALR